MFLCNCSLLRPRERWRSIVMSASVSVCLRVCLSVCPTGYLRSRTRDLYLIFLCMLPMSVARSYASRVTKFNGNGKFWGFSSPLTMHCNSFAAKRIIQSPITSCSRRDHSVCQASANKIRKILSAGKGVLGVHCSAGEVWYLRLPCCGHV